MERTTVASTLILSVGYDAEAQILEIEFIRGAVYQYFGVPPGQYEGIMGADSKGKYFRANIKDAYSYIRS